MRLTIFGEPASKANSRRLVWQKGRPKFIKSQKALDYERSAKFQLSSISCQLLEGELTAEIHLFYASHRPDLDESVVLDVLQKVIFKNDRQIREKHVYHHIDKARPRAEIVISKRF